LDAFRTAASRMGFPLSAFPVYAATGLEPSLLLLKGKTSQYLNGTSTFRIKRADELSGTWLRLGGFESSLVLFISSDCRLNEPEICCLDGCQPAVPFLTTFTISVGISRQHDFRI
jgi:hypothetical protein